MTHFAFSDAFSAWNDSEHQFDLSLEHPWYKLVSRLQSRLLRQSQKFFIERDVSPVLTPVTVTSVSSPMGHGSDSLPVRIRLFEREVFLSDSTQFCLEMLVRHHPNGVFYAMPSFRGEQSDATHLNEFFHIEAEVPGSLEGLIRFVGDYVRSVTEAAVAECAEELSVAGNLPEIERFLRLSEIPTLTFGEAGGVLEWDADCFSFFENKPISLNRRGEARIYEHVGGPCWITHFPEIAVPFYQASRNGIARNADLILGGRETVGAGERHVDVDDLRAALDLRGNCQEEYGWYLRMKERTPIQTAGFGMGIERYLMWLTGHDDIRDIEIFVRTRDARGLA